MDIECWLSHSNGNGHLISIVKRWQMVRAKKDRNFCFCYLQVKRNNETNTIHITQQRYLLPIKNSSDTQTWHIPISYVIRGNETTAPRIVHNWLPNATDLQLTDAIKDGEWFYFNARRTGYYRVNYDYTSWLALIRNYDHLPNITIAQLVDDALNLARAEVIAYDIPLTFLLKLRANDILPWSASANGIEYLTYMLNREPAYEHFRVSKIGAISDQPNYLNFLSGKFNRNVFKS